MGMDTPAFDKWFEHERKENSDFSAQWDAYEDFYTRNSEFFSLRYQHQGSGDFNLFKLYSSAYPLRSFVSVDGSHFSFLPVFRQTRAVRRCADCCSCSTDLKN